jgi:hypothetical protein
MAWAKGDSYERLMSVVQYAAWKEFDRLAAYDVFGSVVDPGFCTVVLGTFPDVIIFEDAGTEQLFEATYVLNGDTVVFGQPKEVQEMYAEKRMAEIGMELKLVSKDEYTELELSGPIVYKSADEQRIAYAAVLVPGEPDSDGEVLTAEKIEEAAHGWMESYRNVDLMHTLNNTGVPVESYILPEAMKVAAYGNDIELPAGTWILASKLSEEAWVGVKDGTLTGYSVMGIKKAHLESATKSAEGAIDVAAFKRTLLQDLGPDWVAAFVSVVDHPAVPKAKFFALKSQELHDLQQAEEASSDGPTIFSKLGSALGLTKKSETSVEYESAEKVGRKINSETLSALKECNRAIKDCHDQLTSIIDSADIKDMMDEEDDSEVSKSAAADELGEGTVTDMDDVQLQATIAEAVKSAVEPLVSRLDALEAAPKAEAVEPEAEAVEEPVAEKAVDVEDEVAEGDESAEKSEDEVVEEDESAEKSEDDDAAEKAEDVAEPVEAAEKSEVEEEAAEDAAEKSEEVVAEAAEKSEEVVAEAAEKSEEAVTAAEEIAALKAAVAAAEETAAEYAAFKSEMGEKVEQLEKRLSRVATTSNALKNDGSGSSEETVEDTSGRDAFGRRIR